MTKAELVNEISVRTGVNREDTLVVVEGLMSEIKRAMRHGENVYLRGFGTFEIKTRKEKIGRNISMNKSITIPEHNIAKFKPTPNFLYEDKEYMKGVTTK
ncbi:MAG: integration host factor subunit beta [Paludibacteraceae bacterium]|nr:integration host factor subunit beta [Paludibacteraceae bacterium]